MENGEWKIENDRVNPVILLPVSDLFKSPKSLFSFFLRSTLNCKPLSLSPSDLIQESYAFRDMARAGLESDATVTETRTFPAPQVKALSIIHFQFSIVTPSSP